MSVKMSAWPRSVVKAMFPLCALLLLFEVAARCSRKVMELLGSLSIWVGAQELLSVIVPFVIINIPLIFAERVWPGTNCRRAYLQGAKFWLVYIVVTYYWSKVATLISAKLQLTPLLVWNVGSDSDTVVAATVTGFAILASVFVFDGFYYWFHRTQHHFASLWRFHRVHHSITHLNCINSYHHPVEEMLRFPFIAIPLALLLKIDTPQLMLVSAFVAAWGQYIHSDTSVHLGRAHAFFADNAYHRIHHSDVQRHFHKNFAAFFSAWDKLFGTYQEPQRGGLPTVGLADIRPPRTVVDYLLMPFRQAHRSREGAHDHVRRSDAA